MSTLPEKAFTSVYAASHYCYALCASSNELYSWGIGENYVLGTREDENCYTPYLVSAKMFYDCKIRTVGTGTQHLAVLTATPDNGPAPQFDFTLPLPVIEDEKPDSDNLSVNDEVHDLP